MTKGRDLLSGRLFVLPSPEELARAAAGRLWGIARERAKVLGRSGKGKGGIHVALSGGRTPRQTLIALSSEPYLSTFPWDLVHFFQVDERWVPAGDPSSNQRMLRESFLSRAPVRPEQFHPVDTSLPDPRQGAGRYEEAIKAVIRKVSGGFPRFDAVLLGLGADGHTASLFPGSPALNERAAWVVNTEGGDPPLPRVTLTLPVLNAAFQVIFLVSGKEKARILEKLLSGRGEDIPASWVSPQRGRVTFLADAAASSELTGKVPPGTGTGGAPGKRSDAG